MIRTIWKCQPGRYFCVSTKTKDGRWYDKLFRRSQFEMLDDYIAERVASRDVYFCPHGFRARRRIKSFAVPPRMLWADMDECDPRRVRWRPTIALQSSPGRYVGLWQCDDVVTEELNRRLSYALGCDRTGWDLTQVLRVPGTINYKYASLPRVCVLWDDGPEYSVRDLSRTLPSLKRERKADTPGVAPNASVERCLRWHSARQYMQPAVEGMRSTMIAGLIYALDERGCDRDGIAWALLRCPSFIDKRGCDEDKAYWEIDNCLEKKR